MRLDELAASRRVFNELKRTGLLLLSDPRLASVAGLVVGEPIRGSWWAHPKSHAIARVAGKVTARPDVLTTKLVSGKVTLVHRKLWAALFAVATAGEAWQSRGLSRLASSLLRRVRKYGALRTDLLPRSRGLSVKALGQAARALEQRLLVFGAEFHTERGSHAKRLETWEHFGRRRRLRASGWKKMPPELAKRILETIAARLEARFGAKISLPWRQEIPLRSLRDLAAREGDPNFPRHMRPRLDACRESNRERTLFPLEHAAK